MPQVIAETVLSALNQRLLTAARVLGVDPQVGDYPGHPATIALPALVDHVRATLDPASCWLLHTAVLGRCPTSSELRRLVRSARVESADSVVMHLIRTAVTEPESSVALEMDVVVDGVVVSADWCARHERHTGIHRVVRRTLPRWLDQGRDFVATAWTGSGDAPRTLSPAEWQRVFDHDGVQAPAPDEGDEFVPRLVVPWRSRVLIVELTVGRSSDVVACMAELSGNSVGFIGYDAIPIVSADLRPANEGGHFAQYLGAVKHGDHVAAISASAAVEFAGFAGTLAAQGLTGPEVVEVVLPMESPVHDRPRFFPEQDRDMTADGGPGRPVHVVCVGSRELHKNHRAVLHAAERLWSDGLEFDLTFVGGSGVMADAFDEFFAVLEARGRPLVHQGRLSDLELAHAFHAADFSVFLSLQEGYGLPVAESLACGTPALTSNFGSLEELASAGGAVSVDPRDDAAVEAAFRRLVTQPDLRAELRRQARALGTRTWDDYSNDLWNVLVLGQEAS